MKIKLVIALSLFVLPFLAWAEVADTIATQNSVQREEQRKEYYNLFSKVPSLLSDWSYSDYSYIAFGITSNRGDFRSPQLFNKQNFLEITTESILTLPKQKLRFYGEFGYRNGISNSSEWNLSYNIWRDGSPYFFMQEKAGNWSFQTYEFNVGMVKSFSNDRISAGLAINYIGDLDFRTIDNRNENYTLKIGISPTVTAKISPSQSLSFGLKFNRVKIEPDIYSKYQHGAEIEKYQVFFNQGLGTWNSNPDLMFMTDNRYGGILAWKHHSSKQSVTLIYHLGLGAEKWNLEQYSNLATTSEKIAKYTVLTNNLCFGYNSVVSRGTLNSLLTVEYLLGEGSAFKKTGGIFEKNFNTSIAKANWAVAFLPISGILKKAGIESELESQHQKDLNYEHTINYTNFKNCASVDFMVGDVRKGSVLLGIKGGYNVNLNYLHTPKAAAANFYNTKIALPALAYLTSNYLIAGFKIGTEFNVRKSYRCEIQFKADYLKPTAINYAEASSGFSTSDGFSNITMNLLFNF